MCTICLQNTHDVRCPEDPEREMPECSECGNTEKLFQLGCAIVCKDCLIKNLFSNISAASDALELYVDSDPNAANWFEGYYENEKIGETWG